jgi:ATP-dependent RNA helicase RhlE
MTVSDISFASLNLSAPIQRALADKAYTHPSPIQAKAIPPLLEGRDLIGVAQTGTGKTAAFSLPMLHRLSTHPLPRVPRQPRALVLTPTRELAVQISENIALYGRHLQLRHTLVFGGVGEVPQIRALAAGVDIVVATPGRLLDLMEQRHISLERVEIFVLDEADRMLDMGFAPAVKRVLAKLPSRRQSLLFSATMPGEIRSLANAFLRDPLHVEVSPVSSTAERIDQRVCLVQRNDKHRLLVQLLQTESKGLALVFTRTKHGANKLAKNLCRDGLGADAIHGNKSQSARQRALEDFRTGQLRVLVATDIAARGIDVKGIDLVVNFDIPNEPESYVHRIGRTARAGAEGLAISLCDETERGFLRDIQRLIRKTIPVMQFTLSASSAPRPAPFASANGGEPRSQQHQGQGQPFSNSHAPRNPHHQQRGGRSHGHSHQPARSQGHGANHSHGQSQGGNTAGQGASPAAGAAPVRNSLVRRSLLRPRVGSRSHGWV